MRSLVPGCVANQPPPSPPPELLASQDSAFWISSFDPPTRRRSVTACLSAASSSERLCARVINVPAMGVMIAEFRDDLLQDGGAELDPGLEGAAPWPRGRDRCAQTRGP